ncbi:hypothetical protein BKA67DRAFT_202022 [Truncatella angustata]|uniref:Uncharacterized protein n=1 Tax=Truncatella angustata TaxID=152316 RepID=A0A9P9A132_9PEZI|nr:uncharacterized protein BKA67DRAFT_202022 [Truncatella angustata]KAH6657888.1 hypothetical protein BKA67DRAFT_202022 [Truncatella angustata]
MMDVQLGPSSAAGAGGFYHQHGGGGSGSTSGLTLDFDPSSTAAATGPSQASYHIPVAPPPPTQPASLIDQQQRNAPLQGKMRKRKAETQDNERLSKRLSLLNLEQNGHQRLYVPVESPQLKPRADTSSSLRQIPGDDQMQLDESKHKVYIYDLDAELSDGESSSDEAKLVFLPDIANHLRAQSRIPPRILANSDGELAGMQLVLYSEPKSLTVPEEQDSVRKAIVEARARIRRKQKGEDVDDDGDIDVTSSSMDIEDIPDRRTPNGLNNLANDSLPQSQITVPYLQDCSLPTSIDL